MGDGRLGREVGRRWRALPDRLRLMSARMRRCRYRHRRAGRLRCRSARRRSGRADGERLLRRLTGGAAIADRVAVAAVFGAPACCDGAATAGDAAVRPAPGWAITGGGRTATAACCSTGGDTATLDGATWPELANTEAGTTVAAARLT